MCQTRQGCLGDVGCLVPPRGQRTRSWFWGRPDGALRATSCTGGQGGVRPSARCLLLVCSHDIESCLLITWQLPWLCQSPPRDAGVQDMVSAPQPRGGGEGRARGNKPRAGRAHGAASPLGAGHQERSSQVLLSPGFLRLFWEISGSSVGSSASTTPAACVLHRQAPP